MTKVSNTKKFATTDHTASPFSIKEAWIWTWVRWTLNFGTLGKMNLNFGTLVHHLWSAGFLNKVAIPCPNTSSFYLLSCGAVSSTSLDSVTVAWKAYWEPGIPGHSFHHEWTQHTEWTDPGNWSWIRNSRCFDLTLHLVYKSQNNLPPLSN